MQAIFKTKDGINLEVEFNSKKFPYSTDSQTIDVSDLISDLSELSEIVKLNLDNTQKYKETNKVTDAFLELEKFIIDIFNSLNESIEEIEKEKVN